MLRAPEYVTVGRIVGTRGLKGEVRVQPLTDFPERFSQTKELIAINSAGQNLILHPSGAQVNGKMVLLKCREFNKLEDAQPWLQAELRIIAAELHALAPGRYYVFQIIGLKVYTEEGLYLGEVIDVLAPGANDVYVVQLSPEAAKLAEESDGKELLLPVIDEVILDTDLEKGTITVCLLPGLL